MTVGDGKMSTFTDCNKNENIVESICHEFTYLIKEEIGTCLETVIRYTPTQNNDYSLY